MTRKSAARLERDQTNKELERLRNERALANAYGDLEEFFKTGITSIAQYSELALQLKEKSELVKFLTNPNETRDAVTTLAKDLRRFKEMLIMLHGKHEGKTGPAKTNEDMVEVIDITQQYGDLLEAMSSICGPVGQQIVDDFQVAQDRANIVNGGELRPIAEAMSKNEELEVKTENGITTVGIKKEDSSEPTETSEVVPVAETEVKGE